jgi:hypothetical protein
MWVGGKWVMWKWVDYLMAPKKNSKLFNIYLTLLRSSFFYYFVFCFEFSKIMINRI